MDRSEPRANKRSDVAAKRAFCGWLVEQGYSDVAVAASPVDVIARKDGQAWLFEVKFTQAESTCFGAATLTEWVAAAKDAEHFRFVVAYERSGKWIFDLYTPEQFMAFSSVPPFKVYFSVPLDGLAARQRSTSSRRIYLTKARLRLLTTQFEELRKLED